MPPRKTRTSGAPSLADGFSLPEGDSAGTAPLLPGYKELDIVTTIGTTTSPRVPGVQDTTPAVAQVTPQPSPMKDTRKPPPAPAKPKPKSYIYYHLHGGHKDEFFDSVQAANAWKRDFGEMIEDTKTFSSAAAFQRHCTKRAKLAKPDSKADENKNNPSGAPSSDLAQQILGEMADCKPVDRWEAMYHTTPHSKMACLVLRARTQWVNDFWAFKPAQVADVVQKYAKVCPSHNRMTNEALLNMTYGRAVDPTAHDKNTPMIIEYPSRDNKQKINKIDVFIAYTWIEIPFATFTNATDEAEWLTQQCTNYVNELKRIMCTQVFQEVLRGVSTSTNFIDRIYDLKQKSNLPSFCTKAVIRVKHCEFLTDHFVRSVAAQIVSHHYKHRNSTRKYPEPFDLYAGVNDADVAAALPEEQDTAARDNAQLVANMLQADSSVAAQTTTP